MRTFTSGALAAAVALAFSASALAQGMTKADYKAGTDGIKSEYKAAKAACDPMAGNAKDICQAQAKGRQQVALAELEQQYKPSAKHRRDVRVAKADAEYSVAKEKCEDRDGNAKNVCGKEARAVHVAARADEKVVEARKDAASDKRDAEYAVVKEKCDALAGTPKDACVRDAKVRFGKS